MMLVLELVEEVEMYVIEKVEGLVDVMVVLEVWGKWMLVVTMEGMVDRMMLLLVGCWR